MASTYSTLKIELIGTGDQVGTWGGTTNTNLGTAIEEAIVGSADVSFSSSDVTLTLTDTNASQAARHVRLNLTGTSGGARNLILGSGCQIDKPYLINNGLADAVTVKNTTGTGITVPAGKTTWVFNNGTNVVDAITYLSSLDTGAITSTGATFSGAVAMGDNNLTRPLFLDYAVTQSNIGNTGASRTFDLEVANSFSATLDQASVFTFSNPPASGRFGTFVLELTNGGAFAITWPPAVDWPGGTAPTLTTAGKDMLVFTTRDAGTTWYGFVSGLDIK
jgi:hypothetical protein